MELLDRLQFFGPLDLTAITLLATAWVLIGWIIERANNKHPSVSVIMAGYRREWMVQFITREPRVFDANILTNLRQGTTFFASASMIGIGGGLALIGNTERLLGIAKDLSLEDAPAVVWEIKILVVILFLANGFLKFVWSHRLFGYCAVVLASVPNDATDPLCFPRAAQAAEINITAARSFNRGLRSVYFALGALAWLLGAIPLLAATALTVLILWRREFASHSRSILLQDE
ncbi:MAG: DUF599 domain-containing protein [Marinosulfonomonas sp.]|nr:DUF599 domain-containing protein [Marinosulfonomonas sp.]